MHLKEEARRKAQAERERRLNALIQEETQYQEPPYGYTVTSEDVWMTHASPGFIAQFRLTGPLMVTNSMLEDECIICLESFRLGEGYAEWPCAAKHKFHFDCMLNNLRVVNKCPLCRHPVEAAPLPNQGVISQDMLDPDTIMSTILYSRLIQFE